MKNLADRMNSTAAKKRKRTVLSAKQHKILLKSFQECAFPDAEKREELGKSLNMSSRTVQIWFQNQRQKMKSQTQETRNEFSSEEFECLEYTRRRNVSKSLDKLAHIACIEYDRKFRKRDKELD